jgi:hypothetical protein
MAVRREVPEVLQVAAHCDWPGFPSIRLWPAPALLFRKTEQADIFRTSLHARSYIQQFFVRIPTSAKPSHVRSFRALPGSHVTASIRR